MFDGRACVRSIIFACWLSAGSFLLGCAASGPTAEEAGSVSAEPDASTPFPPVPCAGRGQPLDGLSVGDASVLEVEVLSIQPEPAVVGDNTWTVRLTRNDEALLGAASDILVSPFMPDHGHGSPVTVVATDLGDGEYELSPVNLFMPGYWEVGLDVVTDAGEATVTLEVCIE